MFLVVVIICLLAYVFKIKNHLLLAALILILAFAGAGSLSLVQSVFSSHFYVQKIDVNDLKNLKISQPQKKELRGIFKDYKTVSDSESVGSNAIDKTYDIDSAGANSEVTVTIYSFDSDKSATEFFTLSQRFYENKNYLQADNQKSLNKKGLTHRYITSYIKSSYPDYRDIIYLPSKIVYQSDVIVMDNDVIFSIHERSNKVVTNKNTVIKGILSSLGDAA
jgi:hypothetical protein